MYIKKKSKVKDMFWKFFYFFFGLAVCVVFGVERETGVQGKWWNICLQALFPLPGSFLLFVSLFFFLVCVCVFI